MSGQALPLNAHFLTMWTTGAELDFELLPDGKNRFQLQPQGPNSHSEGACSWVLFCGVGLSTRWSPAQLPWILVSPATYASVSAVEIIG